MMACGWCGREDAARFRACDRQAGESNRGFPVSRFVALVLRIARSRPTPMRRARGRAGGNGGPLRTAGLVLALPQYLVAASGQNVMLLVALVFGVAALAGVGLAARLVG